MNKIKKRKELSNKKAFFCYNMVQTKGKKKMETIKNNNKNVENSNNFNSNFEKITSSYKMDNEYSNLISEYNIFLEEVQKDYLWEEVNKELKECF
jgi:hypothetical protein